LRKKIPIEKKKVAKSLRSEKMCERGKNSKEIIPQFARIEKRVKWVN